ncbi:MAG: hypothetical protein M1831_000900 [Alyxoria varia]|nr:MAG: hypothetical protein M1831_000900 [Alyxoria varia]
MAATDKPHFDASFSMTDRDKKVLQQTDEEFTPCTWDELKSAIAVGDIASLPRKPSTLKKYIAWTDKTKKEFGSVTRFVCSEKLGWLRFQDAGVAAGSKFASAGDEAFVDQRDFRILRNDWPYGLEEEIVHLIVWSKVLLDSNPDGSLTSEGEAVVRRFVEDVFRSRVRGDDRVVWFKNQVQWQSVGALEHVHVLLRGADEGLVEELTGQSRSDVEAEKFSM